MYGARFTTSKERLLEVSRPPETRILLGNDKQDVKAVTVREEVL
jgi:hypothetical protein